MRQMSLSGLLFIILLAFTTACFNPSQPIQDSLITAQTGNISSTSEPVKTGPQAEQEKTIAEIPHCYPIYITDDLGRKVKVNKPPERIVSLAPSNTEILFTLGLGDRVVGVTDYCNYPEEAKTKTRVAGYSTPDLERLVSLQPDLVFAESIQEKTVLPALERLGMTVYVAEASTMDSILEHISTIGKITGKSTRASQLIDSMKSRINKIELNTRDLEASRRLRVLYINWHDPIWTMGRNTYIDDIITKAGGTNIYATDFEKSRAVSLESAITKNPQVIFVSGMGTTGDAVYNGIKEEVRMYSVDAVKNNCIYKISDANLIERPGPRIVDGLEEVAKMIHPEIFGEFK